MHIVSGCTSTNTGVAPTSTATSAVAVKVNDGTKQRRRAADPLAMSAMTRAVVPLEQAITCFAPECAASRRSSS